MKTCLRVCKEGAAVVGMWGHVAVKAKVRQQCTLATASSKRAPQWEQQRKRSARTRRLCGNLRKNRISNGARKHVPQLRERSHRRSCVEFFLKSDHSSVPREVEFHL